MMRNFRWVLLSIFILGGVVWSYACAQEKKIEQSAELEKRIDAYVAELNKEGIKDLRDFARLVFSHDPPQLPIEARELKVVPALTDSGALLPQFLPEAHAQDTGSNSVIVPFPDW